MHGTAATLPVDALAEPARGAALDSHPLQASTPEAMTAYCYEQCSHAVFRYLACRLRNASDAEDLTQETFIRFHRALGQGERFQAPRSWLFTVAHRLLLDRLKHLRRVGPRDAPEDAGLDVPCPRATPDVIIARAQRHQRLRVAFQALTPRERACLRLRSQNLVLREIAEAVGIHLSGVASTLDRVTLTLHRQVQD